MRTKDWISKLLTENPDGLTMREICLASGIDDKVARDAISRMDLVYVDHWVKSRQGPMSAVWKIIPKPVSAERPKTEAGLELRKSKFEPEKPREIYTPQKTQWAFPPPWMN